MKQDAKKMILMILFLWSIQIIGIMIMIDKPYEPMPGQQSIILKD